MRVANAVVLLLITLTAGCASPPVAQGAGSANAPSGRGARGGVGAPNPLDRSVSLTSDGIHYRTYLFAPTNERMEYAVYVSPRVDLTRPNALVILLHGLGSTPALFMPQISGAVPNANYILAAPMGYSPQGWYGANGANGIGLGRATGTPANLGELSEQDVMNVLGLMREDFRIDPNRIYLFGNSMGGAGAIHLGLKHRGIWAAVGARAPAFRSWLHTPDELAAGRDLPMVLIHGDADETVPVAQSRQWAAKMRELNMTYEYHELPGVAHRVDAESVRLAFAFFDKHSRSTSTSRRLP